MNQEKNNKLEKECKDEKRKQGKFRPYQQIP